VIRYAGGMRVAMNIDDSEADWAHCPGDRLRFHLATPQTTLLSERYGTDFLQRNIQRVLGLLGLLLLHLKDNT